MPPRRHSILARAFWGLAIIAAVTGGSAWLLDASIERSEEGPPTPAVDRSLLANVRSWGYQLQRLDVAKVAAAPFDLVVVDETLDGQLRSAAVERTMATLKKKPNGERRLVVSYLSIGEAEDYRNYWRASWVAPLEPRVTPSLGGLAGLGATPARATARFVAPTQFHPLQGPSAAAPAWLGSENAEWRSNYRVRYWHPDWQSLIFGNQDAALDRIIAAGFDGVYLDRADVYDLWRSEQPTAKTDMVELVEKIAAYARQQRPGFLVIMQNAEELLASSELRKSLDAVAKEDLFYGVEGDGRANKPGDVESSLKYLKMARRDGLPVLTVEYLGDVPSISMARSRLKAEGFIPYFAPRGLNGLGNAG